MEPPDSALRKQGRLVLILGKFRVSERTDKHFKLELGGSTTMTCTVEPYMDVKAGDLLTLYTEVLMNANPIQPLQ
jgi:hypothetical protein